ncbi:hypothetical protein DFH07DRAFT_819022 [Mycena maculata]|uniref:MYND-type domain-containing protein n=1 Tax=Mycena maculata TaxID=230809 RepID=A0AAD7J5L7_9AGAR|nr:hypothetical protein DFH07DRAFT_819022 [Mycena maculata]
MGHTDPWPIELLGMIAYAARSLIIPSILHSPTLIPTVLRIAQQMCDDATSHSSQTPSAPIIFIQIVRRLGFIASFFGNIFLRTGGAPEMLDVLPTDRKTGIVQMCARAIDVLRLPLLVQHASEENRTSVINDLTGIFTLMLDEDVSLDGIDPALIRQALESLDRTVHGPPLRQLPLLLVGWKRTMRCYAMSCQESLQTSQTFKRCSACKVISYCGPNCQKLAWAAHKPICKTIAKITRDGGGDIDSEAFRLNCEAGKVDFRDAQVVIDAFSAWRRTHGGIHL